MSFIRMTATKWRLDSDTKHLFGALLVYMRNEFRAGEFAHQYHPPSITTPQVEGAATNYRRMQQCIDRLLSRIDGNWDAHKLTLAFSMISKAITESGDGHISRSIINQAENAYNVLAIDSDWNRERGTGDDQLPDRERKAIASPIDCERSSGNSDQTAMDRGPGGKGLCSDGGDGTTEGDRCSTTDTEGTDSGQPVANPHIVSVSTRASGPGSVSSGGADD